MSWIAGMARAQADAQRLRRLYGREAETWCADALAALPAGDPRRGEVRRIAKALRALPPLACGGSATPDGEPKSAFAAVLRRT